MALRGLSVLSEEALRAQGLSERLRSLERENESLKKKSKEAAAEINELKRKNSELSSELVSNKAAHLDQIGVINSKVQQLGKEKDAVKRMLDQVADDLRREKDRNATTVSALKDEVAALKSGAVLTDESYSVACKKLFESPQWDEAQIEIMINVGRMMRSEVLEHHPGLDLGFLADRLDVPTPSEQRAQEQEVVTSPPPSEPIVEETGEEVAVDQGGGVIAEESQPPDVVPVTEEAAAVEVAKEPTSGPGRASSERAIFGDCGPIEKL